MSHHRGDIQDKELLIAEYLDGDGFPIRRSSRMEGRIAKQIAAKYDGRVTAASHIGNTYDSIGDTKLEVDGVPNYMELKILEDQPSNFGTLSNNSPKVPIEARLFGGDPMIWKDFLSKKNHTDRILNLLDKFPNYPECVTDKCTTELNTKEHKGRYIRDVVKNRTSKDFDPDVAKEINPEHSLEDLKNLASKIKTEIEEFDREIKLDYIEYLSNHSVQSSKVKAYTTILVAGYHKKKQMLNYLEVVDEVVDEYGFSDVGDVFENYEVFYAYKGDGEDDVTVERDKRSEVIDRLSEIPAENYTVQFGGDGDDVDNTSFSIGVETDDGFEPLIRHALHWGNVFQGISTRRFNCFKESKLNELAGEK